MSTQIVTGQFKHWSVTKDEFNVIWLTFDRKDSSMNTLNEEVMKELDTIVSELQQQKASALVLHSGKTSGFIAGADVAQFKLLKNSDDATKVIRQGQDIFSRFENLEMTTIALIEGVCLGGGLELALCCDYRIALEDSKTRIGLPEVKLGIHPGWGGTVRLPELVGALKAMDLILSGRTLTAKAAKRMGVVDEAVPRRLIQAAVHQYVTKPKRKVGTWFTKASNAPGVRALLSKLFDYQLKKKIQKAHYPAPFHVVENWVKGGTVRPQAMEAEAQSIGNLLVSPTSQNLVHVFFLQEQLKSLYKDSSFKPKHVHVIGAGVMGGDIAAWCAFRGLKVTIQDQATSMIGSCIKRAYDLAKKKLKEPHLIQAMMDRLMPDPTGMGVEYADVIIEAITEKLEAKQGLFKQLEKTARKDAVLATNTSTIPLEEIALTLKDPGRLVGIHFFNPVAMMPLVEVVKGEHTHPETVKKALGFVGAIDKLPLPVKSAPGFLVNRVLMPYMLEAMLLLQEGVSGPVIDKAARDFGMPMGPIELGDTVGLDVCLAACEKLAGQFNIQVPELLRDYVSKNQLGRKTGQGFYVWKKGKPVKPKERLEKAPEDIMNRLILRMLNEGVACLRDGIVESPELLDAGSIFGFGFPPFRGGVFLYAKYEGYLHIQEKLKSMESRYGKRFAPDKGWVTSVA